MKKLSIAVLLSVLFVGLGASQGNALALAEARENLENNPISTTQNIDQKLVLELSNALGAGLETLDNNIGADRLTEQDQKILDIMEKQIPAVLNKIQKSSSEVQDELKQVLLQLAQEVIANQTKYPVTLDTPEKQDISIALLSFTVLPMVLMSDAVEERVITIITNEGMEMLSAN